MHKHNNLHMHELGAIGPLQTRQLQRELTHLLAGRQWPACSSRKGYKCRVAGDHCLVDMCKLACYPCRVWHEGRACMHGHAVQITFQRANDAHCVAPRQPSSTPDKDASLTRRCHRWAQRERTLSVWQAAWRSQLPWRRRPRRHQPAHHLPAVHWYHATWQQFTALTLSLPGAACFCPTKPSRVASDLGLGS